jgi:hypothetical protein
MEFSIFLLHEEGAHLVTTPTPPIIECEKTQACLKVSDLAAAIDFYVKKLGFRFGFTFGEPARFAGLNLGNVVFFE